MSDDTIYYSGVAITILVLNAISLLSLAFVIIIYIVRWNHIASFPMRLSFYLCISCFIQNLYVIMYPPQLVYQDQFSSGSLSNYCIFQALLKTAFDLSSIIWTSIIMYSSYASVVNQSPLDKMELFYLVLGFLVPIFLALIPIFLDQYGFDVYFCWLMSENRNIQFGLKLGYYFVPLWVLFILESVWAFKTFERLKGMGLEGRDLNIFKKILLFPLILLVTGIFPTIDLIYIYSTNDFMEWLDILSYFTLSCYGLCTSLVIVNQCKAYGFNPLIQDQVLILFKIKPISAIRDSQTKTDSSRGQQKLAELINITM